MKTLFMGSSIPGNYEYIIGNQPQMPMIVQATHVHKIFEVMFTATADFLKFVSKNSDKVALSFEDPFRGFTLAAKVERIKNEEEEMPDNMSFVFTTKPEDLEGFQVYKSADPQFLQMASVVSYEKYGMQYKQPDYMITLFSIACTSLIEWLNTNATEKEVQEIEHEGYFIARVSVENGEKFFEILPEGEIKTKIKNDESVEK